MESARGTAKRLLRDIVRAVAHWLHLDDIVNEFVDAIVDAAVDEALREVARKLATGK